LLALENVSNYQGRTSWIAPASLILKAYTDQRSLNLHKKLNCWNETIYLDGMEAVFSSFTFVLDLVV